MKKALEEYLAIGGMFLLALFLWTVPARAACYQKPCAGAGGCCLVNWTCIGNCPVNNQCWYWNGLCCEQSGNNHCYFSICTEPGFCE